MNTHQPPGHRSGEGTSGLWELIAEDDKRKRPSANESLRKPIGDADHRRVYGDVLRPATPHRR
ncbi:hypothetical protein [Ramlibacter montanisoli]|uniref:Uncharacterized protein n=1 Tax=Ramlibacter montanisoli TaxID=2732512 RepID=A0A849KI79_9BURK|nr:hypothetical protein [Ramlibacter montanisoli]NNU43773.1 hypothetical protein [Ramlibacter montanisoli]